MKKILTLALAVCMMLTALTLTASAEDFKLTMRLSHVFSPGEALCDYIDEACNSIREKTNGAIDIQTFPSGQIDVYKDAVMQVVNGANFISVEDPSYIGDYVPDFNVLAGPMMTSSIEEYEYLIHGDTVQEMIKKLEDYNIKVLALDYFFGYRFMKTNKEIYTPDDLKGMKIRVPQADLYVKMVESWGAAATPMNINELYMALQTGTVDGQENPLTTFESYKFYEVVKNVILTNHIICPNMIFMNADVWNSLSEHDQQVVQEAIDAAIAWQDEQIIAAEQTLADELHEKYGVEIITPDDTIREATIPYIQPLIEDWDLIQSMA